MTLAGRIRAAALAPRIARQKRFYETEEGPESAAHWQLNRFNEIWSDVRQRVPYYRGAYGGIQRFSTWSEMAEALPVIDRASAKNIGRALFAEGRRGTQWRSTGGSTGEPFQFPAGSSEASLASDALWYARSWFGITPADHLFLLWGHSHALGTGLRGAVRKWQRIGKDALVGYHRHSAYDLSAGALHRAGEALLRARPRYVLAYASALDRFVQVNAHRAGEFHQLGLRLVVATAEAFPRATSASTAAEVLGAPVRMEYGSVESGPIAHETRDGSYRAFWRDHYLELRPSASSPAAWELLLTSLYPRAFPLIRYAIGDLIRDPVFSGESVVGFGGVVGRCNDYIETRSGQVIHSEALAHVLKEMPDVLAYQIVESAGGSSVINLVTRRDLVAADLAAIRHRLHIISPELASTPIYRVAGLTQTAAGKTPSVIRAPRSR